MADPISALTAVSLADNILSFVKLALKLSKEAYSSVEGISEDLKNVELVVSELRLSSDKLSQGISRFWGPENADARPEYDELLVIAKNCSHLANDLIGTIDKYKVEPGPFRRLRSVRHALLATWKKSDIQRTESLLQKYERQLNTRIMILLK